jgi:hypothetical protein
MVVSERACNCLTEPQSGLAGSIGPAPDPKYLVPHSSCLETGDGLGGGQGTGRFVGDRRDEEVLVEFIADR